MFGASIFPAGAGAALVTDITSAITDNIPTVLTVLGFVVGLRVAVRLLNGGIKGKARV